MIGVMVPTFNERENIGLLIEKIFELKLPDLHLFIVDDNSPDGTADVVTHLAKKYPTIHLLCRNVRGRASAGLDGFRQALKAGCDTIIEMDADLSHNPNDIPRFLEALQSADMVIGSRYAGGTIENRNWFRNLLSDVINFFNRLLLGSRVKDISGGYKCYRREVLVSLDFDRFVSTDYSIGAELLYKISRKKFWIVEIPIHFQNRVYGYSKCGIRQMINYGLKLIQIRLSKE